MNRSFHETTLGNSSKKTPTKYHYYIGDRTPEYYSIGDNYGKLPGFDIKHMQKNAASAAKMLKKCQNIPVDSSPAMKCARKVQDRVRKIEAMVERIENPMHDYVKRMVSDTSRKYSLAAVNGLECDEFEEWTEDCKIVLDEIIEILDNLLRKRDDYG